MSDMWDWLKRLLGLKTHQCRVCGERFASLEELASHFNEAHKASTTLEEEPPKPSRADIRTRRTSLFEDAGAEYPSTEEYARSIKPPSLLELSNRRNPAPSTSERKMPKSFRNRPGVRQAQVNLGKVGYDPKAKMEEDPPRRKRRW